MKRFLFILFEGGGNVPPQLGIARRLVARGHTVRVLADGVLEPAVRAAGCDFVPYRTAPQHNFRDRDTDRVKDWKEKNPIRQLARTTGELMFGPAEKYARDALAEIDRFRPDAMAIDYLVFGGLIAAEKSGLPAATLMHTPYSMPAEGVPPFGLGFRPARGPLGRLRDRLVRAFLVAIFDRQGRPPLNAARAALGLPPLASVFDQVTRAEKVLVLTAASWDFATRGSLPPNVVYVGPELDDPSWAAPWTSPWPAAARDPLVLVALGSTFQDQGQATQRVIEALGGLPARGLVTLGDVFSPSDFRVPPNVVAVASAPHGSVLPLARAVVAHGGHGTVMKALAHGLPLLCVPFGRDQPDNAIRVVACGAGLQLKPSASVESIRSAIARLLDEDGFARAAARLAGEIARDVAADRAVAELEALAERKAPAREEQRMSIAQSAP